MAKILILYASRYGQTEKISRYAAERLRDQGHSVDLWNALTKESYRIEEYDGILIGGGVYARGYPRKFKKKVHAFHEILKSKKTAFFSVCLGVLESDPWVQSQEKSIVQKFFHSVEWWPEQWTIFSGAITYNKYSWFTKLFMKRIADKAGYETETSRDYEYTNWRDVQSFVDSYSKRFIVKEGVREVGPPSGP